MESTASFGYWLRRQRKALDLTQQALAERVGCSVAAIKKIEGDERKPSRQIAERMAAVLGVPADQRGIFLEVARGLRSVDQLLLAREPAAVLLPSGTVTFLYTDIEGSTKLARQYQNTWDTLKKRHHAILRANIEIHHGYIFQVIGDGFCAAFRTAEDAVHAAVKSQVELQAEDWGETPIRVRMGIHTGKAEVQQDGLYHGYVTLSHVQRLMSAGHGGQVLLSFATQELVQDELPEGVGLRDLGKHRLKDFDRPEHLFQLNIAGLPSDFPPLITLDSYRHNLPLQLTSFIGRDREIAEVKYLLPATRLLTLIGPGGTGKTRLSIQVAGELLDQYPDGAWFVEFAPISDPLLIPRTTAIAIGLRDEPQRPVIDMLCDYLRGKQLLLILDNCEHLIEACAQLANTLLHACPQIRILASSREALGMAGETSYLVPSLELPDMENLATSESLSQYEAVRLFIERASAATQKFRITDENASSIAQICLRLDGMPLAIELAAGKTRALSAGQIAQRLDYRFRLLTGGSRTAMPRHQTLQAAIEWSYDLLSPAEQTLFRRLSVFVNGWTLEAAESVCSDKDVNANDTLKTEDILELLTQLVHKSLVMAEERNSEVRYHMLETIRQFGSDKLVEANESESLRDRHLEYFLQIAETAEPHLFRSEQLEWLARLEAEHENMRAALEWSLGLERPEYALRLTAALGTFWSIHCYWMEGAKWLERVLAKPAEGLTAAEKSARALYQDADLADLLDDIERMRTSAEASLALCEAGTDRRDRAIARLFVGLAFRRRDDYENARPLFEQSLSELRELKDLYWEAVTQHWLSSILVEKGEKSPNESYPPVVELARKAGDRRLLADVLDWQALWAWRNHQTDKAEALLQERERLYGQFGFQDTLSLVGLGEIAHSCNDYRQARIMFVKALEQFELIGEKNMKSWVLADLGVLARDEGDF